jgi:Spy/CpxP family protein refolding chaperone
MRSVCKSLLVLGLAALLAGPALAQRGQGRGGFGGGFGRGFGGPGFLLQNPSVQKELKLSDDQIKKITETTESIRDKHRDEFEALGKLEGDEQREKGQELRKKMTDETQKAMAEILKPEQNKRLKEITLQQEGARAFNDAEVQKALNLTDEQKEKIKTINEDAAKEMAELFPRGRRGGGGGPPDAGAFKERMTKMATMRKETLDKVTSVLTDDQKKTWKEMTGAPFEVRFEFPPGGPRGGGRRGPPADKQDKAPDKGLSEVKNQEVLRPTCDLIKTTFVPPPFEVGRMFLFMN